MNVARVASAATALVLALLAAAAGWDLLREVESNGFGDLDATLDERIARAVTLEAARLGIEPDLELDPALRSHTPPGAVVFFLGDRGSAAVHAAFSRCQVLLYPRRFTALDSLPPDLAQRIEALGPEVHLLAYDGFAELDLGAVLDPVHRGARFRLWRVRAGEDG